MVNINKGRYTLWSFIPRIRNTSMQNLWTEQWDNDDWILKINRWISFIYDFCNSRQNWYWSVTKEELTANGDGIFTASHLLNKIHIVMANWRPLERKNLFVLNWDRESYYMASDGRIHTDPSITNITIVYQRKPYPLEINDLDVYIDLPPDLVWILEEICLWRILPFNLHEWTQVANNMFAYFTEQITEYLSNVWYLQANDQFATEQVHH